MQLMCNINNANRCQEFAAVSQARKGQLKIKTCNTFQKNYEQITREGIIYETVQGKCGIIHLVFISVKHGRIKEQKEKEEDMIFMAILL